MTTFNEFWCSSRRFQKIVLSFIASICILLLLGTILYVSLRKGHAKVRLRVDCCPEGTASEQICFYRSCRWVSTSEGDENTPPCFFPDGYGYKQTQETKTPNGYDLELQRTVNHTMFGAEINKIRLQLIQETTTRLRIKITDPNKKRYEVPTPVPDPPSESPSALQYEVEFENDPQFGVKVKRNSTKAVIFDTNVPGMILSDQFLQISTKLPSENIYGLGEHRTQIYRHGTYWKTWTFFARDASPLDDMNIYGTHPFYMVVEENGDAHGVFLRNSNAMQVELQPYPALTFRTIGGILDIYVFLGPTPEDVIKQYLQVIGKPTFPPYWGLGFQMSRWGYHDLATFNNTIRRNVDQGIPLDVMYLDLDYAKEKMMFTYDDVNFEGLPDFVRELHQESRKLVLLLDPAIPSNETLAREVNYQSLQRGKELDVFIKLNGSYLQGEVWPGQTYYPDFTHKNARRYWLKECQEFYGKIEYDGLWVDMNEPSNFVPGSSNGCDVNKWNYPPFSAGVRGSEKTRMIFDKTICMDASQELGLHYNLHNLYGHYHALTTHYALTSMHPTKRPFIIGRSTYAGTSQYAGHWLGDNLSSWSQLRESIPGIMEFNLFGFPLVSADICGFLGNTTEELCLRWMQLGAFYTFSRNHNDINSQEQDPAALGEKVVKASVQALQTRYLLLPYLYTLFYLAHTEGGTVIRPLLHEFPKDRRTWNINYQFLWGPSLLISPAVFEKQETVEAYFPEGIWYDFYTGAVTKPKGYGEYVKLPASESMVNLHVRGGFILPLQRPGLTTAESRKNGMRLLIAPNENDVATGTLYWDNGESPVETNKGEYVLLEFQYKKDDQGKKSSVTANTKHSAYPNDVVFDEIMAFKQAPVLRVSVNQKQIEPKFYSYNATTQTLLLSGQKLKLTESFTITIDYGS